MLEKPQGLNYAAPIAFVPRQVLLGSHTTSAARLDDRKAMEGKPVADKKDKKKKSSKKEKSLAAETLALDRSEGASSLKADSKTILLRSIASYLEANGFPRTVAALRSEAQIEIDDWKGSLPNWEDVFNDILVLCDDHAEYRIDWKKSQDLTKDSISVKAEENVCNTSQNISKKKKKSGRDDGKEATESVLNNGAENVDIDNKILGDVVKSKAKKTKRSALEDRPAENADVSVDKALTEVKAVGKEIGHKNLKTHSDSSNPTVMPDDSHVETKEKKRKRKSASDPPGEDAGKAQLEASNEKAGIGEIRLLEGNATTKDKNNRKHKTASNSFEENIETIDCEIFRELECLTNSPDFSEANTQCEEQKKKKSKACTVLLAEPSLDGKDVKIKEKKKKKEKSIPQSSNDINYEAEEDAKKSGSGKESVTASEENTNDKEMKVSKKRKRLPSVGTGPQVDSAILTNSSTEVGLPGSVDPKEAGIVQMAEISSPDKEFNVLGKKRKTENDKENSTNIVKVTSSESSDVLTNQKENSCDGDSLKEVGPRLANGTLDKSLKEQSNSSKAMKKERQETEQAKKFNAFQRVKIDDIKFADERLQDNSYWAKDGADSGYGAKAQEVLGQVKGRDFRHEKTKKKRGSYRGGYIDLESHSIKFNYSDEE